MTRRRWIGSHSRKVVKSAINRKSAILVGALLFALCSTVQAQPQGKSPPHVGWIWYGSAPAGPLPSIETSIIDGLQELGYVDGKTIVFEHRFAEGRPEKLPVLAAALVQQKVDVIIGLGGDIARRRRRPRERSPSSWVPATIRFVLRSFRAWRAQAGILPESLSSWMSWQASASNCSKK